ncbi:MAG: Serine/threonine-protein phosphatase 2A activator 1 [Sarcosagium campestre]|nr:MAG: Serine/threonine-protein phosphatase 2A activator 1 [Sarcosagium campestre]
MSASSDAQIRSSSLPPALELVDLAKPRTYVLPVKRIHDGQDVTAFLSSHAYAQIMTFLLQLNSAMFPRLAGTKVSTWDLGTNSVEYSDAVQRLGSLIAKLEALMDEYPPQEGASRFGNVSFRHWLEAVEKLLPGLMPDHLPASILNLHSDSSDGSPTAQQEMNTYLLGSFGSGQRLDYGTGHELSFLAFLGCIWKLGGFSSSDGESVTEERGIVLGIIDPYLALVRKLIKTYNLEPAGSHGVWGLDDHSFLPYILGSAQYSPAISSLAHVPTEGSRADAPEPGGVAVAATVERERKRNLYFGAIGFIYDVKRGPFWEHSPMLFDISGVRAGWAKINKGMIKMYNVEVLSKFPVVQHFPFGSLFRWDRDPNAPVALPGTAPSGQSVHAASLPSAVSPSATAGSSVPLQASSHDIQPDTRSRAPWANASQPAAPPTETGTKAPWAAAPRAGPPATAAPWANKPSKSTNDSMLPPKGGIQRDRRPPL